VHIILAISSMPTSTPSCTSSSTTIFGRHQFQLHHCAKDNYGHSRIISYVSCQTQMSLSLVFVCMDIMLVNQIIFSISHSLPYYMYCIYCLDFQMLSHTSFDSLTIYLLQSHGNLCLFLSNFPIFWSYWF
jgi:hypothetical protein